MTDDWPKIKSRRTTRVSPWMSIVERAVEFTPGAELQLYHAVDQQDYVAIVAALPDGRIPIVRQYRPTMETFTWELPAGLVDPGEDPVACCRRELMEETGLGVRAVHALGIHAPCTGGWQTGCILSSWKPPHLSSHGVLNQELSSSWSALRN